MDTGEEIKAIRSELAQLRLELEKGTHSEKTLRQRLGIWLNVALIAGLLCMAVVTSRDLQAAGSGASPSLVRQVAALKVDVLDLKDRLMPLSRIGDDLYITHANLHIRSGAGSTEAPANNVGNLIIGYNEGSAGGGYHNLVIGPFHTYTSYGAIISGYENQSVAPYGSAVGGANNAAQSSGSVITGGQFNNAFGPNSTIAGGVGNSTGLLNADPNNPILRGNWAHVSGGENNAAQADKSAILGGFGRQLNTVQGYLPSD